MKPNLTKPETTYCVKLNSDGAATYYSFRGMGWLQIGEFEKAKSDLNAVKNMGVDINALLQKLKCQRLFRPKNLSS